MQYPQQELISRVMKGIDNIGEELCVWPSES